MPLRFLGAPTKAFISFINPVRFTLNRPSRFPCRSLLPAWSFSVCLLLSGLRTTALRVLSAVSVFALLLLLLLLALLLRSMRLRLLVLLLLCLPPSRCLMLRLLILRLSLA